MDILFPSLADLSGFRALRVLRALRALRFLDGIRSILEAVVKSLPYVVDIGVFMPYRP